MTEIAIRQIFDILPHRYPFLLVDRVLECKPFESIKAIKNVTVTEPFFQGHFPGKPIMPGVLILEAMAQATGLLAFHSHQARSQNQNVYYLVGVDKARFKRPVEPGDQLVLTAQMQRRIRGIYRFAAEAHVDGVLVSSAEFMTTEAEGEG
ncbi:MAG: 3-hydroxyacyl-ACP dehydratase FabZ [Bradyrhizobium sp.]|uniref:3-hydroxyacyl-ACP dehydratase FabZ n=1 Tax=Bradyrhizobium sp. TaxID=376 RepID=UPI003D12546A